jgi:signal transduction histidine kinase
MVETDKITPEMGWLLQRERLVAWLRVAFAALAILVVEFINPSRIARFPTLSLISLGLFFSYSLVLLYRARQSKLISKYTALATTVLDLVGIALIVFSTGGTRTPFFFYYSFPVLTASLRWGLKGSISVALAGVALYGTTRVSLAAEAIAPPLAIDSMLIRSLYLMLLGWVFGWVSEFEKKQNQRILAFSKTAAEAAASEERRRLTAELHDGILQTLATLILRLEGIRKHLTGEQTQLVREIQGMEDYVRSSMKEIRQFLAGNWMTNAFVPGTLCDRLIEDMRVLRDRFGCRAIVETDPEEFEVPEDVEKEIYYVLREGINNVIKHSHASKAEIHLSKNGAQLFGSLTDDGVGFDMSARRGASGFGLNGMQDRIKKRRGELNIESAPGVGTKISFTVPLAELGAQPRR